MSARVSSDKCAGRRSVPPIQVEKHLASWASVLDEHVESWASVLQDGFSDEHSTTWVLVHLAQGCSDCWSGLESLADREGSIDLIPLEKKALFDISRCPPVALIAARRIAMLRNTHDEQILPPVQRYLLGLLDNEHLFEFWWMLIEEVRYLVLCNAHKRPVCWLLLARLLEDWYKGKNSEAKELLSLIRAYEADSLRMAGSMAFVNLLLDKVLAGASECRPEIAATIHEVRSDHYRISRDPAKARHHLGIAENLLQETTIPGRLSEIQAKQALCCLLEGRRDLAVDRYRESLGLIPEGTDPRLRLDVVVHLAVALLRNGDYVDARKYLEEAEPLFEPYASEVALARVAWLWGWIYLEEGDFNRSRRRLEESLGKFKRCDALLACCEVLCHLSRVHKAASDEEGIDLAAKELRTILKRPEVSSRYHDADIERVMDMAREIGVDVAEGFLSREVRD